MELDVVIRERRSIRKFLPQAVEPDKIRVLLESARLCQSAHNRQPWLFRIATQPQKDQVVRLMLQPFEQNPESVPASVNSSQWSARVIEGAPLLLLVFREPNDDWKTGDLLSIGAAIEHICLEAVNCGLGSVWIRDTAYMAKEISAALGYGTLELISSIAVGYSDESPEPRPRKPLEEILLPDR